MTLKLIFKIRNNNAQGGYDIPEPIIRRRFTLGWKNFTDLYRPIVDTWQVFDKLIEQHREAILAIAKKCGVT